MFYNKYNNKKTINFYNHNKIYNKNLKLKFIKIKQKQKHKKILI